MSFASVFRQSSGYYAVAVFALLFGDAVWWRIRHPGDDAANLSLTTLMLPPVVVIAFGAAWAPVAHSAWQRLTLVALGVIEAGLAVAFLHTRNRRWPGAPVFVVAAVVWTCVSLFVVAILVSGDSL